MSSKRNGVHWSKSVPAKRRRVSALVLLEDQLKRGNKPSKEGLIPLEDKDKKRIEREIGILKSRI